MYLTLVRHGTLHEQSCLCYTRTTTKYDNKLVQLCSLISVSVFLVLELSLISVHAMF